MIFNQLGQGNWRRTGLAPKPTAGSNIDTINSLSSGLIRALSLSEGSGNSVYESVSQTTVGGSTLTWRGAGDLLGLDMLSMNQLNATLPASSARTVLGVFRYHSPTNYGSYGAPLGLAGGSTETHGLRRNGGGGIDLVFFGEVAANVYGSSTSYPFADGTTYGWAWGYDGTNVRGSAISQGYATDLVNVANASGGVAARAGLRTAFASDGLLDGTMLAVLVWNRWLTSAELVAATSDPYALWLS